MTAILALACFVTGFIVAVLLREVSVAARISWAQERMQRKVRYWMGEAAHARNVAEQLIYQLRGVHRSGSGAARLAAAGVWLVQGR